MATDPTPTPGTLVRFNHERKGGPVHRIASVARDGMIELEDMGGFFAPHLFECAVYAGADRGCADQWEHSMTARISIDRVLRDDGDATGQTIRAWTIESEIGHVTIKSRTGAGFIILRPEDVETFVADMMRAKAAADSLASKGQ